MIDARLPRRLQIRLPKRFGRKIAGLNRATHGYIFALRPFVPIL
jgi:hypothetical protein